MGDEEVGGIDKQNLLSEIDGVPTPLPPPPAALQSPAPDPVAAPRSTPIGALRRHKWAAMVSTVVALIWLAMGLLVRAWTPSLIGVAFGIAAIAIWAFEVWDGD